MKKFLFVVVMGVVSMYSNYSATAPVNIVGKESSLCLDVSGGSSTPGAAIVQNTCSPSSNTQLFTISYPNDAYANIVANNGLCLTISGFPCDGVPIVQEPCNSSSSRQQFQVIELANNYFAFRARAGNDDFCLSIKGGSSAPNTPLILWHCLTYKDNKQFLMSTPVK